MHSQILKNFLIIVFSIMTIGNIVAQKKEKIKGNKIVTTDQRLVDGFHTIDIGEDFEVSLSDDDESSVEVETDENLQQLIKVTVSDSILKIRTTKDIRSKKALNIKVSYNSSLLKKIIIREKAEIKTLTPIEVPFIKIEAHDNSDAFLTINSDKMKYSADGKSSVELHLNGKESKINLSENTKLKGIFTSDSLNIDLYQKASAKLEGDLTNLLVRTDNSSNFMGHKLSSINTYVVAEGESDCYILVKEKLRLKINGKSKMYLLGDPKITIDTFADEASIIKKKIDYSPSIFK